MKKLIISLLVVTAFVAAPVSLFAQVGTTETTVAKANVIDALSLTPATTGLDFGTFNPGNTGGAIVMTPTSATAAGTRSATGTVDMITGTTTPTCALYTVTGTENAVYTVTIPSSAVLLTGPVGSTQMSLASFTIWLDGLGDSEGILTGGDSEFSIGGTLTVADNQMAGAYNGSFQVTVAYN